jgi:hypothetical protein
MRRSIVDPDVAGLGACRSVRKKRHLQEVPQPFTFTATETRRTAVTFNVSFGGERSFFTEQTLTSKVRGSTGRG